MRWERVTAVTYAGSPSDFSQRSWFLGANQNDRSFWEREYSLCIVVYFDLYYIADVPAMAVYFSSYEWVLNKLTLEGERFVKYRCSFVCVLNVDTILNTGIVLVILLHVLLSLSLQYFFS